ncbi:uncharacterized protein LOC115980953 [Quercus lobata]|uniref:uncharacterized protein LOC115980953 n=1 Tax=Quercus lobata TaxID=97700 RepID=UPI001245A995|nr:uncharacterized protein LOC115980953 [Quercus lobata]
MTGDRSLFKVFESKNGGDVTFSDGRKSQIKGKGAISLLGLPDIGNVLYVDEDDELIVAQVYVDDIIFWSTKDKLAHYFSKLMQAEFEINMIGELNHFLGLQICQQESGIFISQSKYAKNLVKMFGLEFASSVRTPMSSNLKFTVDLLEKNVDSSLYESMISSLLYLTASSLDIVTVWECVLNVRLIPKSLI